MTNLRSIWCDFGRDKLPGDVAIAFAESRGDTVASGSLSGASSVLGGWSGRFRLQSIEKTHYLACDRTGEWSVSI